MRRRGKSSLHLEHIQQATCRNGHHLAAVDGKRNGFAAMGPPLWKSQAACRCAGVGVEGEEIAFVGAAEIPGRHRCRARRPTAPTPVGSRTKCLHSYRRSCHEFRIESTVWGTVDRRIGSGGRFPQLRFGGVCRAVLQVGDLSSELEADAGGPCRRLHLAAVPTEAQRQTERPAG